MITNINILPNEKVWLNFMLQEEFLCRDELVEQINCAEIDRSYTDFYISIKFKLNKKKIKPIKNNVRVPVEMRVFSENSVPIQFFLFVVEGYISELEVFNADSSKISADLNISGEKIEILIDHQLIYCN